MSFFVNPVSPNLKREIEGIPPFYGYCILADIVGSTQTKDKERIVWIAEICNTFSKIKGSLFVQPLKSIGDELMFFIPADDMKDKGETVLTLFDTLCLILKDDTPYVKQVKIAVAYCEDVYDITFIEGVSDVYGKDIDLTARLIQKADSRELIMDERFFLKLKDEFSRRGNNENFPEVSNIERQEPEMFKGFQKKVPYYKLRIVLETLREIWDR